MKEKIELQTSGEIPEKAGFYIECQLNGGLVINPRIVLMEIGDKPLPPTQLPNRAWKLLIEIKDTTSISRIKSLLFSR